MKICPKCHEEVEANFDICWNCNYSFPDGEILAMDSEEKNDENDKGVRTIECLRCQVPMTYVGQYDFHEGSRIGALGSFFELFQHREAFNLYVCPQCRKVEFFLPNS